MEEEEEEAGGKESSRSSLKSATVLAGEMEMVVDSPFMLLTSISFSLSSIFGDFGGLGSGGHGRGTVTYMHWVFEGDRLLISNLNLIKIDWEIGNIKVKVLEINWIFTNVLRLNTSFLSYEIKSF